MKQRLAGSLLL